MSLGAFSLSLSVKDLQQSRDFYEKLGFVAIGGDASQNWLILRCGETTLGLFQGMFEDNTLTFNPGWAGDASELGDFTDIRELQRQFRDKGLDTGEPIDPSSSGPASFVVVDPDGNPVLFDQHVPAP